MFWTIRIPDNSVQVDLGAATAEMTVNNADVEDYHDITNALMGGPSVPSTVSFDIRWRNVLRRVDIRDKKNGFAGSYIEDNATIFWTADRKDFTFVSDPANTSTTVFAEIGKEHNGVFF